MLKAKERRSKDYLRSCYGKVRYRTEADAERVAMLHRLDDVLIFPDREITHYPCRYGNHWHVGNGAAAFYSYMRD